MASRLLDNTLPGIHQNYVRQFSFLNAARAYAERLRAIRCRHVKRLLRGYGGGIPAAVFLQEGAEFHNIVVFGKQAELVSQYLKKGSSALIEGRIQTRSWDGQDGEKKYRTEIVADRIQFGPRGSGSGLGVSRTPDGGAKQPQKEELETIEYPEEDIKPEDIPF